MVDLTREAVDDAIKTGELRKCQEERLRGMHYFADAEGTIFSYNRQEPSKILSKPGNGGLLWVTLYTKEGIARFCVGDLVASAFIGPRPSPSHILAYRDNDTKNNRPENLYWDLDVRAAGEVTEYVEEEDRARPPEKQRPAPAIRVASGVARQPESPSTPPPRQRSEDNQARIMQELRAELEQARSANIALFNALKPFASFELPQSMHLGADDKIVIEANVGLNNHCQLRVSDFTRAAKAYEG